MNTFDNIFSRKSIRTYNGKNITEEELGLIIKPAHAAPDGRARFDSLHITVISNREHLPEGMVPCCAITLGYTDEKYELRDTPENKISTSFIK